MAVSKRLRFEILRRDNHTCQYCGEKAPNVTLHVDHVVPVSLGGTDKPDNLVAACKDCNLGKTSLPADAPLVASVGKLAAAYAVDVAERMDNIRKSILREKVYADCFEEMWELWDDPRRPLPNDYRTALYRWCRMGVPLELVLQAISIAMDKENLRYGPAPEFAYMAGVVWRTLDDAMSDGGLKGGATIGAR